MKQFDVVQLAHQVLKMADTIERQAAELEELRVYRQKYIDEMQAGIAHGEKMMCGIVDLVMRPGVSEALAASSEHWRKNSDTLLEPGVAESIAAALKGE